MEDIKFQKALEAFDKANSADPNSEMWKGKSWPKELLYARRMSECLASYDPLASEALQLAARSQHICRWQIPRSNYPIDKKGYHQWRLELMNFHAEKTGSILRDIGYSELMISKVSSLLRKKDLKHNPETQTLEDVICLVFLQFYFSNFAKAHSDEKLIDILRKTWRKMSEKGQRAALELPLDENSKILIEKALRKRP